MLFGLFVFLIFAFGGGMKDWGGQKREVNQIAIVLIEFRGQKQQYMCAAADLVWLMLSAESNVQN